MSNPSWLPDDADTMLQSAGTTETGVSLDATAQTALLEAIEADPNRKAFEKETNLLWNSKSSVVQVHTAEPALMRRFVLHEDFRLRTVEVARPQNDRATTTMDTHEFNECVTTTKPDPSDPAVYSINGILPVGAVSVSKSARKSSGHANVVSSAVLDNDPRNGDSNGGDSP